MDGFRDGRKGRTPCIESREGADDAARRHATQASKRPFFLVHQVTRRRELYWYRPRNTGSLASEESRCDEPLLPSCYAADASLAKSTNH